MDSFSLFLLMSSYWLMSLPFLTSWTNTNAQPLDLPPALPPPLPDPVSAVPAQIYAQTRMGYGVVIGNASGFDSFPDIDPGPTSMDHVSSHIGTFTKYAPLLRNPVDDRFTFLLQYVYSNPAVESDRILWSQTSWLNESSVTGFELILAAPSSSAALNTFAGLRKADAAVAHAYLVGGVVETDSALWWAIGAYHTFGDDNGYVGMRGRPHEVVDKAYLSVFQNSAYATVQVRCDNSGSVFRSEASSSSEEFVLGSQSLTVPSTLTGHVTPRTRLRFECENAGDSDSEGGFIAHVQFKWMTLYGKQQEYSFSTEPTMSAFKLAAYAGEEVADADADAILVALRQSLQYISGVNDTASAQFADSVSMGDMTQLPADAWWVAWPPRFNGTLSFEFDFGAFFVYSLPSAATAGVPGVPTTASSGGYYGGYGDNYTYEDGDYVFEIDRDHVERLLSNLTCLEMFQLQVSSPTSIVTGTFSRHRSSRNQFSCFLIWQNENELFLGRMQMNGSVTAPQWSLAMQQEMMPPHCDERYAFVLAERTGGISGTRSVFMEGAEAEEEEEEEEEEAEGAQGAEGADAPKTTAAEEDEYFPWSTTCVVMRVNSHNWFTGAMHGMVLTVTDDEEGASFGDEGDDSGGAVADAMAMMAEALGLDTGVADDDDDEFAEEYEYENEYESGSADDDDDDDDDGDDQYNTGEDTMPEAMSLGIVLFGGMGLLVGLLCLYAGGKLQLCDGDVVMKLRRRRARAQYSMVAGDVFEGTTMIVNGGDDD